jgi:uncharacterized protein YndB with AHSA1/START domain
MKTFAVALTVLTVLVAAGAMARKGAWVVKREAVVAAPPELVFGLASEARSLDGWSWWHGTVAATPGGAPTGVGATLTLSGNNPTTLVLQKALPPQSVAWAITAERGGLQTLSVDLAPHPQGTLVTLLLEGTHSGTDKLRALVMDVDRLVGRRLDESLERLSATAQALTPKEGAN